MTSPQCPAPLMRAVWPVFYGELDAALRAAGQTQLAGQLEDLRVVAPCPCRDTVCQSFYTAVPPSGAYGQGLVNVVLDPPWPGDLILDVVDGRIKFVEILYRPALA